jgi:hypothetical protein
MEKTRGSIGVQNGNGRGKGKAGGASSDAEAVMDTAEHLTRDLARVRAKFGMDPALAPRSLAAAWQSETLLEEDEAEFVDTVADCLGAGLSLEDALNCWDTGDLAYDAEDQAAGDLEDESLALAGHIPVARHVFAGHRLLVR